MKFAIFREIQAEGKKKRVFLAEWDEAKVADELEKQLPGAAQALDAVIRKFKKKSIRIP